MNDKAPVRDRTRRNLGAISLAIAASGAVVTHICLYCFPDIRMPLGILADGFEAATIGGVADWFAVTALFREVPIPVIRRHTNIIVKNRKRIAEGIVDMVQTKWLTPEAISERLSQFSASHMLFNYLEVPAQREKARELLRDVLQRLTNHIDQISLEKFLDEAVRKQLQGLQLAAPLGRWMVKSIEAGDHQAIFDGLAKALLEAIQHADNRRVLGKTIEKVLEQAIDEYKKRNIGSAFVVWLGRATDAINSADASKIILKETEAQLEAISQDRNHPWRLKLTELWLDIARKLAIGDKQATAMFEHFQQRLADNIDLKDLIHRVLTSFKNTVQTQLAIPNSPLRNALDRLFDSLNHEFKNNVKARDSFDIWVRRNVQDLVLKHHNLIGDIVASSLSETKLSNATLVEQIESKVGPDLQYIRLNGAVVGGIVGVAIAFIKLALT